MLSEVATEGLEILSDETCVLSFAIVAIIVDDLGGFETDNVARQLPKV